MARMILAFALCSMALALTPAAAQNENTQAAPIAPMAPPAPNDSPTGSIESAPPKEVPAVQNKEALPAEKAPEVSQAPSNDKPQAESKAPESAPIEIIPQQGAATESKPADNADSRFTFTRMNDGYVRLDNRTGQVSVCSKRAVGWTCQLAAEDRGVLEGEINRLQEENVSLKKELLANGLPLPGSMKGEPPVVRKEHSFSLPSDQNIDRMKAMVEKAWRRLVDMISALQKDVLKKS